MIKTILVLVAFLAFIHFTTGYLEFRRTGEKLKAQAQAMPSSPSCTKWAETAEGIMKRRQVGTPQSDQKDDALVLENPLAHAHYLGVVEAAYRARRYTDKKMQSMIVNDFGNAAYRTCSENNWSYE